jgi:Flp pilus assembly pilin Flp
MRRLTSHFTRFRDRTDGIAAVEFALILPIMAVMLIGAVQISEAVTADRRVSQVSTSTGDLIARKEDAVVKTELQDIARIGGWLMAPFPERRLEIDFAMIYQAPCTPMPTCQNTPPVRNHPNLSMLWQCKYKGVDNSMVCTCPKSPFVLPSTGLINWGELLVRTETRFAYQPNFFDLFFDYNSTYTLTDISYLKPRGAWGSLEAPEFSAQPSNKCMP